ncbi:hypothetical protein [Kutzneria kofuensis]|uniref:DUF222 domain-containing protein n=1 Tax=Kutzneria kofuensis TaxID=103725 RepID=A0A7W9KDZ7_9PSEU|nr:hypothetical protein [Kutzneria kofuensis]MBB5890864.1 hypothetical protein [Kutzneria kofuensis]
MTTLLSEALNLAEDSQTGSELVETVRKLVRLESAVRAAMSHAVAVAISQGAHESAGHATAAELLRSECHLSGREANELAVSAVRLREQLPCTLVALQSGLITWAHATTLVRAIDRLGLETVRKVEHDWIELIATRTGPEALQRLVHTRHLEQVGYPSRTASESPVSEALPPRSNVLNVHSDASTATPEAASTSKESQAPERPSSDEPTQDSCLDSAPREAPSELSDGQRSPQAANEAQVQPDAATEPAWPAASTLTLSSDNSPIAAEESTKPTGGCVHPRCATRASLREIAFTVHWLDGGQSTILSHGLVCDEHAAALTSCPLDRIRVGQSSMIRTIGPALVTDAA